MDLLKNVQNIRVPKSITGQIEYWAKLGKLSEENPEYNHKFIKDKGYKYILLFRSNLKP